MPRLAPVPAARRPLAALALAALFALAPAGRADDAPAPQAPDDAMRAEVVRAVAEMREEASRLRGLPWKFEVPADLLSRAQLKANLEAMIQEDFKPDEYARDVKILRRLGMLADGEDPLEMTKRFLEAGIAGYYNPKTKRLYIIDGLSADAQRPTILHELIHALEDQYVDLEKLQKAVEKDSDRLFATKCMVEGSAERARKLWEQRNPEVARRSRAEQAKAQRDGGAMQKILGETPAFLFVPSLLHYQMGPALVTRYVGADYQGGIARMYAGDAPVSQEQCVHPGRFVTTDRDLPRTFEWPAKLEETFGPGWKGLEAQPIGELDFCLWMSHFLGENKGRLSTSDAANGRMWAKPAGIAAEGWDGMKAQVLEKDGAPTALVVASAWDSHDEAAQAATAIENAFRAQHGDTLKLGAWGPAAGEGGRKVDFTNAFGRGRIQVRGDVLLVLDGAADATFDAAWARLEAIRFVRDEKDTWQPGKETDPLAAAVWKGEGAGWNLPDELWTTDEKPGSFGKGALTIRLAAHKQALPMVVVQAMVAVKRARPKAKIDPSTASEFQAGGKNSARIDFADPGAEPGPTRNSLIFVIGDGVVVVVEASTPDADWDGAQKDLDAALEALVFSK